MKLSTFLNTPIRDHINNLSHKTPKDILMVGKKLLIWYIIGYAAIILSVIAFLLFLAWAVHSTIAAFLAGILLVLVLPFLIPIIKRGVKR